MVKIKGWKNTSRTHSDGSKTIEWRSKTSKVNVWNWSGWNWSVNSTTKSPTPYITDTHYKTKEEVLKLATNYMRSHPNG